jgi:hypothetical protein
MTRFIRNLCAFAAALLLAAVIVAPLPAADAPKDPPAAGKNIDVVICLDCSNSMDGLINSAKTRLWSIVNDLAKSQPAPNLRVALYSYGNDNYDKAVGWVRKDVDLTTDLDAISAKLFALTTRGGTEYVARVTRDALDQQKWAEDKDSLKLIFVCGNEPASQDKEVHLKDVAAKAVKQGVIINPIFCGPVNHPEATDWKEFAQMCGGKFSNIDQDNAVTIVTPMDKQLAELSSKLNTTYVGYGVAGSDKAVNQTLQDANAAKAAPSVAAARAMTKGGALYRNSDWDLVDKLESDPKFDLSKVPEDQLCDALKKLKPEERLEYVKDMAAKRKAMQKEIAELGVKREAYLREEMKKQAAGAGKALDEALRATIREQAAAKGIKIPE